jgi:cbb3-type cytochrome oxidase cytochrome c subunit/mono/diheme cytochrome c family protein
MAGTAPTNHDTVYKTRSLSKWFAIGSILLLISVIWAAIQDYARPWKTYQRQYKALLENAAQHQMDRVQKMMDQAAVKNKLKDIEDQIAKLETGMNLETLIAEVDAGIEKREGEYYKVNSRYQLAKAELDALHYKVEHATMQDPKEAAELKERFEKESPKVEALRVDEEKYRLALNELKDRKLEILKKKSELEADLAKLNKTKLTLQKQIDLNANSLGNLLRNAPVVDLVAPTIKINQIILDGLYDDYFFNKVARVDRCMTCHVTADQPGFEKYPEPFKTHPKLDLMVGPDSPHPYEKVGCTTCHAGVPQSVDFNFAAHTPKDPIQAAEWEEQYGFHYKHDIKTPMVPLQMVEGKCIQCHAKEVFLKGAPTFNAGMRLVEQFGCYGCHKITGHFEQLAKERKPGPPLTRVAGKLDPTWVKKWLLDPKSFRPTATMPNFWKTHNNSDPESLARGYVEIDAIQHYLYEISENYEPVNPPGVTVTGTDEKAKATRIAAALGKAEKGKELLGSVGCLACHASADFPRKKLPENEIGHVDERIPMFGPELNQMGSKVSPDWLYSWLINPKHYSANSNMPSLKLSTQEAKDLTAYLIEKRNEKFEGIQFPEAKPEVRDSVALEFLKAEKSTPEAVQAVAKMSVPEKQSYLGKKLVSHYGCYACHAIKGFEDAPKIGAELSFHGSKEVTKFAFENVHIPHSQREWWIFTKVRTPRIWDLGKIRDFQAKARMPHFGFTADQATAITAIVIGQESKKVDDAQTRKVDARLEQIIAGHRVLHRYNCVGCHAVEGRGGGVLGHYEDPSEGPPNLNTEGRKVQPQWLFSFLKNTNLMIRPWVKIRMPQFYMSDEDARTLVKYFAAVDGGKFPFTSHQSDPLTAPEVATVDKLIQAQGCLSCHAVRKPGEDVSSAAPHFQSVKARLNGDWVVEWIHDPNRIMPGTRMPQLWPPTDPENPKAGVIPVPGFFGDDGETQIRKVRDYLFQIPAPAELPPKPEVPLQAR